MLNDMANPIINAYVNKQVVSVLDNDFIKINHYQNAPVLIIPLISFNEVLGVMVFCGNSVNQNVEIFKLITNFYSMFY